MVYDGLRLDSLPECHRSPKSLSDTFGLFPKVSKCGVWILTWKHLNELLYLAPTITINCRQSVSIFIYITVPIPQFPKVPFRN